MASDSKTRALLRHPRYVFLFLLHRCSHLIKSDKFYYKCQYRLITGKKLDFDHPISYNEKLQGLKLYDRKPIYTTMVDKLAVKKYVADKNMLFHCLAYGISQRISTMIHCQTSLC